MPMICNNVQQFVELRQKYPWANLLVVYCDPEVHGQHTYNQIVRAMTQARQKRPANLNGKEEDQKNEVVFAVTTSRNNFILNF